MRVQEVVVNKKRPQPNGRENGSGGGNGHAPSNGNGETGSAPPAVLHGPAVMVVRPPSQAPGPREPRVLCAIPCFNEEVAIGSVVLRARKHVDEVVVVDDGSTDRTSEVARLAGATVLRHTVNRGKGGAYRTFWDYAKERKYDILVTLDGDGQHDPDQIPLLVEKAEEEADFVIGARWGESTEMPFWRKIGKRVLDAATAAGSTGSAGMPKLMDSQSGFRAYGKNALVSLRPGGGGFGVESELLMDAHSKKLRFAETRIDCKYDGLDCSTQKPVKHAAGVLNDVLIAMGLKHPLLLMGVPGFLLTTIGIGSGAWAVYAYQAAGSFAIGWVLISMLSVTVGLLTGFTAMLFHLLPKGIRQAAT